MRHEAMTLLRSGQRITSSKRDCIFFKGLCERSSCERGTCRLLGPCAGTLVALCEGHRTAAADAAHVHARRVRVFYLQTQCTLSHYRSHIGFLSQPQDLCWCLALDCSNDGTPDQCILLSERMCTFALS